MRDALCLTVPCPYCFCFATSCAVQLTRIAPPPSSLPACSIYYFGTPERKNTTTTTTTATSTTVNEKQAGKVGLLKCAAARIIWNVPVMMFPPIIMSRLERLKPVSSNPRLRVACETAVVTTCLLGAVSPALAFFPQRDSLSVGGLEDKFSGLVDKVGRPVTRVWYNKGL